MLILCIGPDTFRAQKRAQELEKAFREKHDPSGTSIERIWRGKTSIDEVIERVNTVSLFSSRRFLRTACLLSDCSKAKQNALIQALNKDEEHVIVVSVETEPLSAMALNTFKSVSKTVKYEYPELKGVNFKNWLLQTARELGITDEAALSRLVETTEGDTWLAWNELLKMKAGGTSEIVATSQERSVYGAADAWLDSRLLPFLQNSGGVGTDISIFLSQARSALRVADGSVEGLHPYVVQKMRKSRVNGVENHFAQALLAVFAQRSGLAVDDEVDTLLS